MSDPLHLVRLSLDRRSLLRVGQSHRHPSFDEGYLLHAGLAEAFAQSNDKAEVPLHCFGVDPIHEGTNDIRVLAYADLDAAALRGRLGTRSHALGLALAAKPMPVLAAGTRADFWVRVCPTVRTKKPGDRELGRDAKGRSKGRELDAYVHATLGLPNDARSNGVALPTREDVYGAWLGKQLGDAASLVPTDGGATVRLPEFRRDRVYREHRAIGERPNAVLEGTLVVKDEAAFRALLRRGIGRHRAFGFGMLLLRPPRS